MTVFKCRSCNYVVEDDRLPYIEEEVILFCNNCKKYNFVHLYPSEKDVLLSDKYEQSIEMSYENQKLQRENLIKWDKFMTKFEGYMEKEFGEKEKKVEQI